MNPETLVILECVVCHRGLIVKDEAERMVLLASFSGGFEYCPEHRPSAIVVTDIKQNAGEAG